MINVTLDTLQPHRAAGMQTVPKRLFCAHGGARKVREYAQRNLLVPVVSNLDTVIGFLPANTIPADQVRFIRYEGLNAITVDEMSDGFDAVQMIVGE